MAQAAEKILSTLAPHLRTVAPPEGVKDAWDD